MTSWVLISKIHCVPLANQKRVRDSKYNHRAPTQSVCVADSYFIVNVLELPFASPIAIYKITKIVHTL